MCDGEYGYTGYSAPFTGLEVTFTEEPLVAERLCDKCGCWVEWTSECPCEKA